MSIKLDTVELPDVQWDDEYSSTLPVAAVVEESIINTPIVFEGERSSGFSIDLVGGEDFGWITKATMDALKALASVVGAVYVLEYEGKTYNVRFRHEEGDPLYARQANPRPNVQDTDWYLNVIIKLMII